MRCAFIVRASTQMGVGHLMRCMALAQALSKYYHESIFLLDKTTQSIAKSRLDWSGEILNIDDINDVDNHISLLLQYMRPSINWIVIDGYSFDYDYCQAWRSAGFKVTLFDDGIHQPPYGADLLVNASSRKKIANDGTPILAGSDYRVLRDEFAKVNIKPVKSRRFLTLAFGGSDPANLTIPLLARLNQLSINIPMRVITGGAYSNLNALNEMLMRCSKQIEHTHAAQDMAKIWSESKLAVSAAGGSQFELAVCATPSLLVVVAENQLPASELAADEGWCSVADLADRTQRELKLDKLCDTIQYLWENEQKLIAMQKSVLGKYDALGAERIVQALVDY